ncbi:MAG: SDR family NAD(P)-dependent oxidoreductase [Geminicoccaceae bacterium]|nr:SDR family NAD(P)-dependent oxidoreductase [Geminicoccaceae bacterium]
MGRRVWITGASAGIGRAVAERLARDGDTVHVSARREDELDALATTVPGRLIPAPLDVTDHDAVQATVARIEERDGPLDLVILNAGTHQPVEAKDFSAADLRKLVELNVMGTASCLEAVMPRMIDRRAGHIAVVASVAGYRGLPTSAYYGATKAALINMVESLRFDLDEAGVRIQIINPGFVETPLTDKNDFAMPFIISTEKAADYIARGLNGSSFEIVFPKRFAAIMKNARLMPYRLYFPAIHKMTGK